VTKFRRAVEWATRFSTIPELTDRPSPLPFISSLLSHSGFCRLRPSDCEVGAIIANHPLDMIAFETNLSSLEMINSRPALEIRFQFVDGTEETFIQNDAERTENFLRVINPAHLFYQSRIVVADDYSKSVFVCSQINRIDFVFRGHGFSHIPADHADLVELSEADFRKHVPSSDLSGLQKRTQHRRVGDLLVSFLNLRMRGGSHVYLMNETLVKLPPDNHSYMQRLLSKGPLCIRQPRGGETALNLANLIGYSVYPGVTEIPADSWMAQPKGP
jgi:hypothetical protein